MRDKKVQLKGGKLMRKNEKVQMINFENSIQKSNEFSMAKLNSGLSLNQMQLLAFAIFSTQRDGKTDFHKADFEKKFNITQYRTSEAKKDAQKLTSLQFSIEDLEKDYFEFINIFGSIKYDNGEFIFKWNEDVLPHIIGLKEKYITTDLTITSNFKSSFSWTLYDYLKAHYGYWHKPISKDAALKLFGVEDKKTYQKNSARFKETVLDVAINEINEHTEFEVWYKEEKEGRSIAKFDLHWSTGKGEAAATQAQIKELKAIVDAIMDDPFKYADISNEENRHEAIERIRKLNEFFQHLTEPVCITKQFADNLLTLANDHLRQLELLLAKEIELKKNKAPEFYNWLEDRE